MPNDVKTYDLIIVGAGSGNMIPVPEMDGWNLAIVEADKFGYPQVASVGLTERQAKWSVSQLPIGFSTQHKDYCGL
jgi:pyruvate/2-oxoglutarate dehydrogenase complex dihydrolipoamide dehydrogenase (E3) component